MGVALVEKVWPGLFNVTSTVTKVGGGSLNVWLSAYLSRKMLHQQSTGCRRRQNCVQGRIRPLHAPNVTYLRRFEGNLLPENNIPVLLVNRS